MERIQGLSPRRPVAPTGQRLRSMTIGRPATPCGLRSSKFMNQPTNSNLLWICTANKNSCGKKGFLASVLSSVSFLPWSSTSRITCSTQVCSTGSTNSGRLGRPHSDPAPFHGPTFLELGDKVEPHNSVEQIQASPIQNLGDAVQMGEELRVGPNVQRAKQNVREVELVGTECKAHHVTAEEGKISAQFARSSARELDHLGACVESEVSVAALMPFVQIGTDSRAQLKDAPYLNL